MRNLVSFMHVSLDGCYATADGGLDFVSYDEELEAYAHSMHATSDVAVHGRVTYEMMRGYWPTVLDNPDATPAERKHARWLHDSLKVVVSRTLDDPAWENSMLIKDNLLEEFTTLKQQPGKDMVIFGSPGLVKSLTQLDLIDEFRLSVNPVILGSEYRLFGPLDAAQKVELVENRTLKSGAVVLRYKRVRG